MMIQRAVGRLLGDAGCPAALILGTLAVFAGAAFGEPEMAIDAGATIPLSTYSKSVDEGGSISISGSYGTELTDWLWAGAVLDPRFSFFAADERVSGKTSTLFSLTAGPRIRAHAGDIEGTIGVLGGLYTDVGGPFHDTGGGWNAIVGLHYYLVPGLTSLGITTRYDWTTLTAAPGSDADRQFLTTGIVVQHNFLPPPPAPSPVPAAAAPPPAPPAKQKIVLRGVNFDFDRATIQPEARPVLDDAIRVLQEHGEVSLAVEGYTDARGTDAYNLELSERRARAVASYLVRGGLAQSRIEVKGFGEANPIATNDTPEGRAQNRRVELRTIAAE